MCKPEAVEISVNFLRFRRFSLLRYTVQVLDSLCEQLLQIPNRDHMTRRSKNIFNVLKSNTLISIKLI